MALLDHFVSRRLDDREACALMGIALTSILTDHDDAREFLDLLASHLGLRVRVEPLN
jgi:hypothetical protein